MNLMQILRLLNESDEPAAKEYELVPSNRYLRELGKIEKASHNWQKDQKELNDVLDVLKTGAMPQQNRPHKITWQGKEAWDIHIGSPNSDWLLVVQQDKATRRIYLLTTGTHSQGILRK